MESQKARPSGSGGAGAGALALRAGIGRCRLDPRRCARARRSAGTARPLLRDWTPGPGAPPGEHRPAGGKRQIRAESRVVNLPRFIHRALFTRRFDLWGETGRVAGGARASGLGI
ncbi:hypothetical protein GCM10027440_15780 [Nocardiopsis coralliicola]